jgi:hypothetical protein
MCQSNRLNGIFLQRLEYLPHRRIRAGAIFALSACALEGGNRAMAETRAPVDARRIAKEHGVGPTATPRHLLDELMPQRANRR